jgi:hypothetical protein
MVTLVFSEITLKQTTWTLRWVDGARFGMMHGCRVGGVRTVNNMECNLMF